MHLNKLQLITLPLISPIFPSLLLVCIAAAIVDVHVMYWCNVLCLYGLLLSLIAFLLYAAHYLCHLAPCTFSVVIEPLLTI